MNKVIKVLISLIIGIITVFGLSTISNAYHVGQKKFITYQDYLNNGNMYCLEHHDSLRSSGMTYTIVRKVTIKGKTAKADNKKDEVVNIHNARLAYIVNAKNHSKTDRKNAVWNFMGTWMNSVGNKFGIKYLHNFVKGSSTSLDNEAAKYEKRFKESTGDLRNIEDKTEKEKVKAKMNGSKMIVGPLKWDFEGDLSSIVVKDENGKKIDNVKVGKYIDKEFKVIDVEDIKSNKNFYLYIPFNTDISKIKVTAKAKVNVKAATLWFLKAGRQSWQNMMIAEPSEKAETISEEFTYKPELYGSLDIVKVNESNKAIRLPNVEFYVKSAGGKYVQATKSGNKYETNSYVEKSKATKFKTDENGEILIEKLVIGNYEIYEISNPNFGYDQAVISDSKPFATVKVTSNSSPAKKVLTNKQVFGTLDVIKVNENNKEFKLPHVKFLLKTSSGEYVKANKNGNKYVAQEQYVDQNNATVFETDGNGEILVEKLLMGEYGLCEIENPNYGYDPAVISKDNPMATVIVKAGSDIYKNIIGNKQIHVKLSGYVWEDIISDEKGDPNHTLKDSIYTSPNDKLMESITVKLMDRTTKTAVMTTTTDKNGAYLFNDVLVEKLVAGNYYIEFEYDGITYTNVNPLANGGKTTPNNSKAAEDSNVRKEFNNKFATIEGRGSNEANKGDAISTTGEKTELTYNIKTETEGDVEYTRAIFDHNQNKEQYQITATTDSAKYYLKDMFTYGMEEIKNNNLGLWKREQPILQVMKDLENVRVTINGYENTYQYASRIKNRGKEAEDGFNVGVKFGTKYGSKTYSRAIYKEDYQYIDPTGNKDKELKVYATYRIVMKNSSNTGAGNDELTVRVNSIADYFDKKYTFVDAGTNLDDKGNIANSVGHSDIDTTSYANHNKVIINNNNTIKAGETASVFVQLQLKPEKVIEILDQPDIEESLEREFVNIAELNSYSVLRNNEPYAGIDQYSNPGNVEPGNRVKYEFDTDSAPALRLEVANARKLTGTVFEDYTGELKINTGEVRQGDGKFDTSKGDVGIEGVEVILKETTGSGKEYRAVTNADGSFEIEGFIPGDYTLTYIWGDQKYTVQNYKSTIYSQETDERKKNIENWDKSTDWYRKEANIRFSDARDNYDTRIEIDHETEIVNKNLNPVKDKMDATAPKMAIGVEIFDTTAIDGEDLHYQIYTDSDGHEFKTVIENVDFGIARRPMQQLGIIKRVKAIKATLANGQVIVDATIENGEIKGQRNHTTYMAPTEDGVNKGFVKLELDNELIQGCSLEVEYEIIATNESELDYKSKEFYYYGTREGELATLTPNKIIDYLDEQWAFEENDTWKIKQKEDIKDLVEADVLDNMGNRKILYTESLNNKMLKPGESASVEIKTSKLLSTTDEIDLNNETELVEIGKSWGSILTQKPGDYLPGKDAPEEIYNVDSGKAEDVIVTPSTGEDKNYIMPIAVGTIALVILGAGVVVIKKKTLTK